MTFAGEPRNHHRYDHAHESPRVMTGPLVLLAVFAIGIGWKLPAFMPGIFSNLGVETLLDQNRPVGTLATKTWRADPRARGAQRARQPCLGDQVPRRHRRDYGGPPWHPRSQRWFTCGAR